MFTITSMLLPKAENVVSKEGEIHREKVTEQRRGKGWRELSRKNISQYLIAARRPCEQKGKETHANGRKVREKVQARANERFERDCQNVAGGNVSGEVERSQTEPEQEVETIISVCESPRVARCDVTGSPSSVSTTEDKRGD